MKTKSFKRAAAFVSSLAVAAAFTDFSAFRAIRLSAAADERALGTFEVTPQMCDYDLNGNGTIESNELDCAYVISSVDCLEWFADKVNSGTTNINAVLVSDITLNENLLTEIITVNEEDGTHTVNGEALKTWTPIKDFKGVFDGKGHEIRGLYFYSETNGGAGFFESASGNARIRNLGIADSYISATKKSGAICATVGVDAAVENCCNKGIIAGSKPHDYHWSNAGGICGYNYGTIINCHNEGKVYGNMGVAGIAANNSGTVKQCYNTGEIVSLSHNAAGICGDSSGNISECYNIGSISGEKMVGGICGESTQGTISECYNIGSISGEDRVGGICGEFTRETISGCYNIGSISGNSSGGICGFVLSDREGGQSTITNCFYSDNCSDALGTIAQENNLKIENVKSVSQEQITNGYLCNNLNQLIGKTVYYQNIGSDDYPVLDSTHDKVIFTKYEGKAPSCTSSGHKRFWICKNNDKLYADEDCSVLIEDLAAWLADDSENGGFLPMLDHKFVNGVCQECGARQVQAKLKYASLTLDGSLVLNLYMTIDESITETAEAVIELPNGETKRIAVDEAETVSIDDTKYYIFKARVSAKEMNDDVSIRIINGENESEKYTVSVAQYAEVLKTSYPSFTNFTDAMLNYGGYASSYFLGTEYDGKKYDEDYYKNIAEKIPDTTGITVEDYYGSSLLLKEKVILRHYFTSNVTGNMKSNSNPFYDDGYFYVEKEFTPNGYSSKIEDYDYCIYDYIKKVLKNTDEDVKLRNLCAALYDFSIEATHLPPITEEDETPVK